MAKKSFNYIDIFTQEPCVLVVNTQDEKPFYQGLSVTFHYNQILSCLSPVLIVMESPYSEWKIKLREHLCAHGVPVKLAQESIKWAKKTVISEMNGNADG